MAKFEIDPEYVRQLAEIMNENGLWEMQMRVDDTTLRLSKGPQGQPSAPAAPAAWPMPMMPAAGQAAPAAAAAPVAEAAAEVSGTKVTSPMVGTAYLAPEPGARNFIAVGDKVNEGQTLLIVEAMKVMNPIPSPASGTVRQILVSDGAPVEFGEPLIILD